MILSIQNENLKKGETALQNDLASNHTRYNDMVTTYNTKYRKYVATVAQLKEDNHALMRSAPMLS